MVTIEIGARVTVVQSLVENPYLEHEQRVAFGTVNFLDPIKFSINSGIRAFVFFRYDQEGISWIRGWHMLNSEETQALLAAWSLCK